MIYFSVRAGIIFVIKSHLWSFNYYSLLIFVPSDVH